MVRHMARLLFNLKMEFKPSVRLLVYPRYIRKFNF